MGNYFGISTAGSSDTDQLVEAYKKTKQPQIDTINAKKKELETSRSFFSTFNTRLNNLVSSLDKFDGNDALSKFVTRKVSVSNSDYLSATVDNSANIGSLNVKVERLASSDTLITARLDLDEKYGAQAKDYSFNLKSGDKSFEIAYTLDGNETNEEAMNKIVTAINNTEEINVSANFIKDTSSTGRISLVANNTGQDYSISVTGNGNALRKTGLQSNLIPNEGNRKTATDTEAGYAKSNASELNARLNLNGINIERNSNSVDDLIKGMTINLKKPQGAEESPVNLNTDIDTEQVVNLIAPLLNSYNATLTHLASNKQVKRSDPSVSSLHSRLRSLSTQAIITPDSHSRYLMEIGIKVQSDGQLKIDDKEKLEGLLKDDPKKVSDLFLGDNGFISKIKHSVEGLSGSDGLIQSRRDSLTTQINHTETRTSQIQKRIEQEADNLRKEYSAYMKTFLEAQGQYSLLATMQMPSQGGSGYDSLLAQSYGY